jgi:hypothetical protein
MAEGNPYQRPRSSVLVHMIALHKWADHLDDHTRRILEWAEEDMRARDEREAELKARLVRQALHLERAEARR